MFIHVPCLSARLLSVLGRVPRNRDEKQVPSSRSPFSLELVSCAYLEFIPFLYLCQPAALLHLCQ